MKWIILILSVSLFYISQAHGDDPFFSIALSKFDNKHDAAKEESRLKNSGHNAFYREEKIPDNNSTVYQVYIEKYNSMDEAEKEARVLKDLELISDYTVREIRETPQAPPEQNPTPTPTEKKEQVKPGATAPEQGQVKQKKAATSKPDPGTERKTTVPEPSPVVDKQKIESLPTSNNKRSGPDQKTKPKKKPEPVKFKPITNHDDESLTGASLQVGAFSDEANAASLKKQLRNMGKNAFYRYESADSKGKFYRLYITGYSSLRDAIKDAKALLESGVISGYSRVHSKNPVSDIRSEEKIKKETEGKVYLIHISSNKDETNAVENVARLKKYGYKAFYVLEKDLSESWYRVYIGGFKDEAEAREKGMELLDRGIISYFKPIAIDRKKLEN